MQKTVVIQIGNSDDKLTQVEWADFVKKIEHFVESYSDQMHFFGGSSNWEMWQNVCWVVIVEDENIPKLTANMTKIRRAFKQDSIAVSICDDTLFV